jgi:uncharacterized protein YbjT (DUF2867 family)
MNVALPTTGLRALDRSMVDALRRRLHRVRLVAADDVEGRYEAYDDVEVVRSAASEPEAFAAALHGCGAMIDLGTLGATIAPRSDNQIRAAIGQTRLRLRIAGEQRVSRLVVVTPRHGATPEANDELRAVQVGLQHHPGDWLSLRVDEVYGVSDDRVSRLLQQMRMLPAIPMASGEVRTLYPVWHEDLTDTVAASVDLEATMTRTAIDVRGPDAVTPAEIMDRLKTLIDRKPLRVPIPSLIAAHASTVIAWPTIVPVRDAAIVDPAAAPIPHVPGVTPTTIDEGLGLLIEGLDEQTPSDGMGTLEIKRFFADIRDARVTPSALLREFRLRFGELVPAEFGVEPASPQTALTPDATLTTWLPGRGHAQVRVEEITDRHVTLATLRGHPLAGIVHFSVEDTTDGVRFAVTTCDTPATRLDWLALTLGGARIQDAHWCELVRRVVTLSGGISGEPRFEKQRVHGAAAQRLDAWIRDLIARRQAQSASAPWHETPMSLTQVLSFEPQAPATRTRRGIE